QNDVVPGIYYNDGTKWIRIGAGTGSGEGTHISYNPVTYEINYTDAVGNPQVIKLNDVVKATETLTSLVNNGDGTITYTDERGNANTITLTTGVGADGKSALDIWRELTNNPSATAAEFIDALRGVD